MGRTRKLFTIGYEKAKPGAREAASEFQFHEPDLNSAQRQAGAPHDRV